jgi:hypothetical protein
MMTPCRQIDKCVCALWTRPVWRTTGSKILDAQTENGEKRVVNQPTKRGHNAFPRQPRRFDRH